MIESFLKDYLNDHMSVPACLEVPKDQTEYLLIERTGGGGANRISTVRVAIQSYGISLYRAALINEELKKCMEGFADIDIISKAKLDTDYNFTDTSKKRYRYQAIYEITFNGAVLSIQE